MDRSKVFGRTLEALGGLAGLPVVSLGYLVAAVGAAVHLGLLLAIFSARNKTR